MSTGIGQFFQLYFGELERQGVPYVVLHSYQDYPEKIDSDLDYSVRDGDLGKTRTILAETAEKAGWLLVQTLQYGIGSFYSVVVDPKCPENILKLDLCSHYTRIGRLFIRDEILLADRRLFKGFYVPRISSEFIYMLCKVFDAKGKKVANYLPRLRDLWAADSERSEELFHMVYGPEVGSLRDWFSRPPEDWSRLKEPMFRRNRYRLPQKFKEYRRQMRRAMQPSGLRMALLGDDAAEKTRVAGRASTLLEPCFRRQAEIDLAAKGRGAVADFFRCWLSYWRREHFALRRSTCVILIGYFEDRFVRQNGGWLAGFLRLLLPRPHLTFLLSAKTVETGKKIHVLAGLTTEAAVLAVWREAVKFLAERERNYRGG